MKTILAIAVAVIALLAWYLLRGRTAGSRAAALPTKAKGKSNSNSKNEAGAKSRLNKQLDPGAAAGSAARSSRRSFKAAAISPCKNSCEASRALASQRFLVEQAPRLPLEGCDRVASCACKYHNYSDRRQDDERRNLFGALSTVGEIGMKSNNKRSGADRRSSSLDNELDRIDVD